MYYGLSRWPSAAIGTGMTYYQVLNGVSYLSTFSLTHPSLTYHDILFRLDGVVKIGMSAIILSDSPRC